MAQSGPLNPSQSFSMPYSYPPLDVTAQYLPLQHGRSRQDGTQRHSSIPCGGHNHETLVESYDMGPGERMSQIDENLRSLCGIDGKFYLVATLAEDSSINMYSSPGQPFPHAFVRLFFNKEKFRQIMNSFANGDEDFLDHPFETVGSKTRAMDRRQSSAFEEASTVKKSGMERTGARQNEDAATTSIMRKPIVVGETDTLLKYYQEQFRNCQQTACKLIAKAWVKAVEPKKQSTHPYTGKIVPDWWPKPWGPSKEYAVRHKEPDHLYKWERVYLLAHILRMVVKARDEQHPDIQKLGLNVEKLKDTAFKALYAFFMKNEANDRKRPFLNEIFMVASQEQRYENGEIEGTTKVMVLEIRKTETYASDKDEQSLTKEENGYSMPMMRPRTMYSPVQTSSEGDFAIMIPTRSFRGGIPSRSPQFHPSVTADNVPKQSHSFEDNSISGHEQPVVRSAARDLGLEIFTGTQATSRLSSVFSDYPGTPYNTLYNHHGPSNTTGPNTSPTYPFVTPQSNPQSYTQTTTQPSAFDIQNVPMNPAQSVRPSLFDGSPRYQCEPGSDSVHVFGAGTCHQYL